MHNILKQNTLARHSRRRLREEKGGTSVLNVMLDIAGLIPGVGEYFDAINALLYAKKGEWLLAALSLISAIPTIGDIVGKGGKLAVWATKTFPKAAGTTVKYGPKIVEAIKLLKIALDENKELIESILKRAEKNEEMKKELKEMFNQMDENNDGKLSENELYLFMCEKIQPTKVKVEIKNDETEKKLIK